MHDVTLIFPHQLFQKHPSLQKNRPVYLVEEWLLFRQYPFHKKKLTLHRASMQFYKQWLEDQQYSVNYIETTNEHNDIRLLISFLAKQGIRYIHIVAVTDNWLLKRITESCVQQSINLIITPSPGFLNTPDEVLHYFNKRKTYFQTDFYTQERKKRKILLEPDGKPIGGKWTFDAENRLRFPKTEKIPTVHFPEENAFVKEAKIYVNKHFPHNYGNIDGPSFFVTTYKESEQWLNNFIETRLQKFGDYEDAIVAKEYLLHHSALTPMLNIGLLTPQQVLQNVLDNAVKNNVPLNSLEGFIRQIIGWREFIRTFASTISSSFGQCFRTLASSRSPKSIMYRLCSCFGSVATSDQPMKGKMQSRLLLSDAINSCIFSNEDAIPVRSVSSNVNPMPRGILP